MSCFLQRDNTRADYGMRDLRAGFSLDLSALLCVLDAGQVILDNRTIETFGVNNIGIFLTVRDA